MKSVKIIKILIFAAALAFFISQNPTEKTGNVIAEANSCLERNCIDSSVFKNLPAFPENFNKNKFDDEQHWKQPEFYPTWKENMHYYTDPFKDYIGVAGYGAYPGDEEITLEKEAEEDFLFHASWYVSVSYTHLTLPTTPYV